LLTGKKKSDISEIISLLKRSGDDQRDSVARQLNDGATEQFRRFGLIQDSVNRTLQESRAETNEQLSNFSIQLDTRLSSIQEQTQRTLQTSREETNSQLREFQERLDSRLSSIQRDNAENIEKVNSTLEGKMKSLQESNEKRLEQMQGIVDEKLQTTLDSRLKQSFELVGKQLDSVQQGLGEMKNLAADAKSLKNALTNVKERGTYGEVRLEKLLSDILAPNQYEKNIEIDDNKRVEFAVNLPGNGDAPLLLPIDSKFPLEDYNRLLDAEDRQAIDEARKSLERAIRTSAKDIHEKYIKPPKTTDFALMFLPTEGLYAEAVRNAVLFEELREKYKVIAVGPTTLSALLASLLIGFKTLTIEQRSQDIWNTLRGVKAEFANFGAVLNTAGNQLDTVKKTLDKLVTTRTKAINRKLKDLEESSEIGNTLFLKSAEVDADDDNDDDGSEF